MQIAEVTPEVIAFLRPDEGANVGLIRTADGIVLIDTTSCARDLQQLLDAVQVSTGDIRLAINTHSHSDHTWGNQLLACPILASKLCRETMLANLEGPWDIAAIEASIAERGAKEPNWAREMRAKIAGLQITLPTETFLDRCDRDLGGISMRLIHVDAHSPGSAVVWLPGLKVLFAGDLIFQGRYPFLGDADIPALIAALKRLPEFGTRAIVPGHGLLCTEVEIAALVDYLEGTWARTAAHIAQGHSEQEAIADAGYPRYAEKAAERLHDPNIRVMYAQLTAAAP